MSSDWDFSFFWEDDAVYKLREHVVLTSFLEAVADFVFGDTLHSSYVSRVETRVSGDDDIAFDMYFFGFELEVIVYCAVKFSLLKDVILVYDLD